MSKDRGEKSRLELKDELEGEADLKEPATIDIEALLGRVDCILLRGNAGMGKTTLIKHLANTITEGSCQSSLRDYLPVMVFLKDLWLVYREEMKKSGRKITFEPLLKAYRTRSRREFVMTLSNLSRISNSKTKVTAF
jgi:energy-coupling factor transporter ATP-binding protein EcfA2